MMAPRMAGFRCCHSPSPLVTLMKSVPKNTPLTPSISNSRAASGEALLVVGIEEFERAVVEHGPARNEFQGRRVRRGFGLDEHGASLALLTREPREGRA